MKVNGVEVKGPAEEVLVLPRPTSEDLIFRAKAVLDMDEFYKMVPEPKAKARLVGGKGWEENLDDPDYIRQLGEYGDLRFAWLVIKSLEPSNIEWDRVNIEKPSTWKLWTEEMKDGGVSQTEINRVINCVATANSLNEQKLEAARESFLQGLAKASEKSSGPNTEQANTQSGEPVNG
jgi:hypothetical protein